MTRRTLLFAVGAVAGGVTVSGCGGSQPKPTILTLQIVASPGVNPDAAGVAKPLHIRLLQLTSTSAISQADFFAVSADPVKTLGSELLSAEDAAVSPGQKISLENEAKPGAKYIGIIAEYSAIDHAKWRVWAPVKPNTRNNYTARLGAGEVTLTEGGA